MAKWLSYIPIYIFLHILFFLLGFGQGNGNPLQYSCLDTHMGRRAWWATVHRVTKSQTRLKWLSMHGLSREVGYSSTEGSRHSSTVILIVCITWLQIPSPSPSLFPPPWKAQVCSLCLSLLWADFCCVLDLTCKWYHAMFVFVWLETSLWMIICSCIYVTANGL